MVARKVPSVNPNLFVLCTFGIADVGVKTAACYENIQNFTKSYIYSYPRFHTSNSNPECAKHKQIGIYTGHFTGNHWA